MVGRSGVSALCIALPSQNTLKQGVKKGEKMFSPWCNKI